MMLWLLYCRKGSMTCHALTAPRQRVKALDVACGFTSARLVTPTYCDARLVVRQ